MGKITCYDISGVQLTSLYQWDSNRSIVISGVDPCIVTEVHFCNIDSEEALVVSPRVSGNDVTAAIPNILLQKAKPILVYVFSQSESSESRTVESTRIVVIARPKPANYVYYETEVFSYSAIDKRLLDLEESISEMIKSVNGATPDEYGNVDAKPDWGENDETAPGYIKNRPFYEDENKTGAGAAFSDRCTIISSGIDYSNSIITDHNETPANGQRFYVFFDDAEYLCEVETVVIDSDGNTEQGIGNKSIRNPDLEDTGEPFYAGCTYWGRYVFMVYAYPGEHIFQVFEEGSAIQYVNEKFIPKTIARVVDIPRQQNANWDMSLDSHVSFIHNRPFYDNNTITEQVLFTELDIAPNMVPSIDVNYRIAHGLGWVYMVTFDSVDYYIQPLYCDNNEESMPFVYLGNASLISPNLMNTGEPFCLKYKGTGSHSGTIYVYADSGMHTIFVQKVDFKQLDEKFIPSTIARTKDIPKQVQADFEAKQDEKGHILNRPMNRTVNYTNVIENVDVGSYCIYDFRNYPGSNYKNYLTVEGLANTTSEISYALTYEGMTSRGWYEINFNFYGFKPFDGVNLKQTINTMAARLTEIYCVQDYTLLSDELKEKMPHNGVWIVVTGTEAKDNLRNFTLKQYYYTKLSANYLPKEIVMQKAMENYVDNALANVPKQILLVNVSTTYNDSGEITYSADKTIDEMLEAIQAGIPIVCMYGRQECSLNSYSTNKRYISFVFHVGGRTNSLMCAADEWTLNPTFDAADASMFPIEAKPGQVLVVDTIGHGGIAKLKTINMPTGGNSEEWETIVDYTVPEDCVKVVLKTDKNGNPFSLKKAVLTVILHPLADLSQAGAPVFTTDSRYADYPYGCNTFKHFTLSTPTEEGKVSYLRVELVKTSTGVWNRGIYLGNNVGLTTQGVFTGGRASSVHEDINIETLQSYTQDIAALGIGSYMTAIGAGTRIVMTGVRE